MTSNIGQVILNLLPKTCALASTKKAMETNSAKISSVDLINSIEQEEKQKCQVDRHYTYRVDHFIIFETPNKE